VRSSVSVGLVDGVPVRIRVDRQRTRVHPLRNVEVVHHLEHVACPVDVDSLAPLGIARADLVPAGDVEHAIDTSHRIAERRPVGDVALDDGRPVGRQWLGVARPSAKSRRATWPPTNPVAPVTKYCIDSEEGVGHENDIDHRRRRRPAGVRRSREFRRFGRTTGEGKTRQGSVVRKGSFDSVPGWRHWRAESPQRGWDGSRPWVT
jgi:hypothetical protein